MTKSYPTPQAFSKEKRPNIPLTPVKSSQIAAVGHDPATSTLAVQFTRGTGALYCYPNVSAEAHAAFMGAKSLGTHFGKHIKHLPFRKFSAAAEGSETK